MEQSPQKLIDHFINKAQYNRYLWAVETAKKVNAHLDKGDAIFNKDGERLNPNARFVYNDNVNGSAHPILDLDYPGEGFKVEYLDEWDDDYTYFNGEEWASKVWIRTKKEWREIFERDFHSIIPKQGIKSHALRSNTKLIGKKPCLKITLKFQTAKTVAFIGCTPET